MPGMFSYSKAAVEREMKIQEVILRAMARKITWWQAAEILGFSDRHLRRIRERYEEFGYESMFDKRRGQPSPKRVPFATVEKVLALYGEKYFDLNVRHFHEKLGEQHGAELHLGEVSVARGGTGGAAAPARHPSQAPAAASLARGSESSALMRSTDSRSRALARRSTSMSKLIE